MNVPYYFNRNLSLGLLVCALGAPAQTRPNPTDDQVQANVLRSLAAAHDLAGQSINITTTMGVVTLSGSVQEDAQRTHADQLASTSAGVRRVIDQLAVSNESPSSRSQASIGAGAPPQGSVLQSDGSYTTSPSDTSAPSAGMNSSQEQPDQTSADASRSNGVGEVPPPNGPNTDPYGRPLGSSTNDTSGGNPPRPSDTGYPNAQSGYGPPPPSGGYNAPYPQPQRGYNGPYPPNYGPAEGQAGGKTVSIPAGTVLRVRVNQHLSSRDVRVGTPFDAIVANDVVADGQVAIPRGTFLQGTVVEAINSGHLSGRGELGLQLSQLTLGGKAYPVASDVFSAHGGDKTIQTVNSAVGLGALGAIFGAVAGGGAGAAIGAGAGGALGLGASAASGRGNVFIPSESILNFRLTQPVEVTTVSQAEMQRLASGVPPGEGAPRVLRRYPYPYYGPVVYPRIYYAPGYYPYR